MRVIMETLVSRVSAFTRQPVFVLFSSLVLTVVVVLALLFFSEFGASATDVIYGEF
jgi:hypothetical protein